MIRGERIRYCIMSRMFGYIFFNCTRQYLCIASWDEFGWISQLFLSGDGNSRTYTLRLMETGRYLDKKEFFSYHLFDMLSIIIIDK